MNILFVSLSMSLLIIIVALHRRYFRNSISNSVYYLMWLLIAIRLVLPFDFSLNNSIRVPRVNRVVDVPRTEVELMIPNEKYLAQDYENNSDLAVEETIEVKTKSPKFELKHLWISGAIIYLAFNIVVYINYRRGVLKNTFDVDEEMRTVFESTKRKISSSGSIEMLISSDVSSPQLIGLFKPKVLIPVDMNVDGLEYIILHELMHYKRKDILFKILILLAKAIHWFNPVVHLMGRLASEDIELSCDEEVLKIREMDGVKYSQCLIKVASSSVGRNRALTVNYVGGVEFMKKRIDNIFLGVKKSPKYLIVLLIMVIGLGGLLVSCKPKITMDDLRMNVDDVVEDKLSYYQEAAFKSYKDGKLDEESEGKNWYEYLGENKFNYKTIDNDSSGRGMNVSYVDGIYKIYDRPLNKVAVYDTTKPVITDDVDVAKEFEEIKEMLKNNTIKKNFISLLNSYEDKYDYEIIGEEKFMERDAIKLRWIPNENTVQSGEKTCWIDMETWVVLKVVHKHKNIEEYYETTLLELNPKFGEDEFKLEMPDDVRIHDLNENPI